MPMDINGILGQIPGSNTITVNELKRAYDKAGQETAQKYSTLDKLVTSGLKTTFDSMQRDFILLSGYNTAGKTVNIRLGQESTGLTQLEAIMTDFRRNTAELAIAAPDMFELANTGLAAVQKLLNTQVNNGDYLFGGIRTDIAPVQKDLTDIANTNIGANNQITTNYTTTAPNPKNIAVSNFHTISYGVSADNQAFAQVIGALNLAKDPRLTDQLILQNVKDGIIARIDTALKSATQALSVLKMQNGLNVNQLTVAQDYNVTVNQNVVDTNAALFIRTDGEMAIDLDNAKIALYTSYNILKQQFRVSDTFFSTFG